jgi:cell division protein FtsB
MIKQRALWMGLLLITGIVFLQYRLWMQPGGVHDLLRLKKELALQVATNDQLHQRNDELLMQIQRLQNSEDAVETRARGELGMIKKDETFYQVVR